MSEEPKDPQNLLISASNHPSIHRDLEKIGEHLDTSVKSGGTKTTRVRLAVFLASKMTHEQLIMGMVDMNKRELMGESQ